MKRMIFITAFFLYHSVTAMEKKVAIPIKEFVEEPIRARAPRGISNTLDPFSPSEENPEIKIKVFLDIKKENKLVTKVFEICGNKVNEEIADENENTQTNEDIKEICKERSDATPVYETLSISPSCNSEINLSDVD